MKMVLGGIMIKLILGIIIGGIIVTYNPDMGQDLYFGIINLLKEILQ